MPGFEDLYDVSDWGRVRSRTTYHGVRPPRLLKPDVDNYGYPVIRLSRAGTRTKRRVHQLVLAAFVGSAEGRVTRHLDGDPSNNHLGNLAYGTQAENVADILRHGTHHFASRTHCANGHEYTPENTRRKASKAGRICVTCDRKRSRDRARARRARLKEAA